MCSSKMTTMSITKKSLNEQQGVRYRYETITITNAFLWQLAGVGTFSRKDLRKSQVFFNWKKVYFFSLFCQTFLYILINKEKHNFRSTGVYKWNQQLLWAKKRLVPRQRSWWVKDISYCWKFWNSPKVSSFLFCSEVW